MGCVERVPVVVVKVLLVLARGGGVEAPRLPS